MNNHQNEENDRYAGAISVPSTPYMPNEDEKDDAERKNTAYADYSGQPSVNSIPDPYLSEEYDPYEDEYIQEGGVLENALPSLPIYKGRELLK